MECDECTEEVEEVTTCTETPDKLRHFNPQAVDFLRRCDTEAQAEEIIAYLQKKGEITAEYAEELRMPTKERRRTSFRAKKGRVTITSVKAASTKLFNFCSVALKYKIRSS